MAKQHTIPPINTAMIDKIMRNYNRMKDKLGLRIHVHNPEHLVEGQIFLYNHFARFETVIPHYINHQLAGAYTRTIADKGLFGVNKKLTNIMLEGGAVPNNQEGLLPFLAAEVLRGNKIVIFPEGGIVKSRKVFDDEGNYSVWSGKAGTFRKHHKGAAVLALTLDLFKQRILGLFEDKDHERLERWRTSLELSTLDELRAAAEKPTLIVPGNITFYPIRISDNFVSRILTKLKKDIPDAVVEEAIIEGNILFKDTDMTIRYSSPIKLHKQLSWAEQALLKRHFLHNVKSLNELFAINRTAKTWPEKFLMRFMSRETDKIRDQYMAGLYQGITINLSHVASRLMLTLYEDGVRQINREEFSRMVYLTIKHLQNSESVHAHTSIAWPHFYRELLQCRTPDLKQFLATCVKAELLKKIHGPDLCSSKFEFLEKMSEKPDRNMIRRNNPVLVYANECEPITAVQQAVDEAIATHKYLPDAQLADYLFDDELKDFTYNHGRFSHLENHKKFPCPCIEPKLGEPYFLPPTEAETSKIGVILVHGFVGAPVQLRAFGEHLNRKGHAVVGVRLPGHGTSMHDLQTRSRTEWVNSVKTAYKTIAPSCDKVVIVGFSTGGVVSALMAAEAAENPLAYAKLKGLVFASAPVGVQDKNMHILPIIQAINNIGERIPFYKRKPLPFYKYDPSNPHFQYPFMPVNAINELRLSIKGMQRALTSVTLPTLILQGKIDPTVLPNSAKRIQSKLGSDQKDLHMIDTDQHDLIGKNVGPTWQLIEDFMDGL